MIKRIILFLLFLAIFSSVCADTFSPEETLDITIGDISLILNHSEFDDQTERQAAEKIICGAFSLQSMAGFILKERWNDLNENEKENFTKHLSGLITGFYLATVKKYYEGCSVKYLKTASSGNNKCSVHIRTSKRGKNNDIIYSMIRANEWWAIYDVKIQGVSLLRNYQAQFEKYKTPALQAIINPI